MSSGDCGVVVEGEVPRGGGRRDRPAGHVPFLGPSFSFCKMEMIKHP